jgi:hypothetical protein
MEEGIAEITNSEETSEIRFAIRTYDDIFSDFDPREISKRGLSEDFISEAKRASAVKEAKKIDFIFLVPKKVRDLKEEKKIEDRLKKYFKKHSDLLQMEKNKTIKHGIYFIILGIILMFIATFLIFKFKNENLITSFLVILFEPAGWFLFWEGLHEVLFDSRKVNPNIEFHKKMANTSIKFVSV